MGRQHFSINGWGIAITDNPVRANLFSILCDNPSNLVAIILANHNLADIRVQQNFNPLPTHQIFQLRNKLAGSAHTEINAPFTL